MKITVKDLIELGCFDHAEVAAGKPYLGSRVQSVSVMDSGDPDEAEKENGREGALVLTSFRSAERSETKVKMVRRLADSGVSGLCVFHAGGGAKGLDKDVIAEAEAKGLPLIVMPDTEGQGYQPVIEQVMDRLLNGGAGEGDLINSTVSRLLDFDTHRSFQEALMAAAISGAFQVVLFSRDLNPVLTVETRKRATIQDAIRASKGKEINREGTLTPVDVNGLKTYWGPVDINGNRYHLMIVDNEDNYSMSEITKLAEIVELAMAMWKFTPERDVRAEFIRALMRNNKSLAYTLRDELGIDPASILSVFYARGIDTQEGNGIIASAGKNDGIDVMRITQGDETNGVLVKTGEGSDDEKKLAKYKNAASRLFDDLAETGEDVRIFHATGLGGVESAGDYFHLIAETWPYAESIFPYKKVFTKFEFALVANAVGLQIAGGQQKKNYTDLLEPFYLEVGEAKGAQLLSTLETFVLDAGMNIGKTSKIMGIHTNTVQYRLKRINEILGAEITGNRVVPGLTVALALKRIERVGKEV